MAFLRVKRIGGREYAYLVKSEWDPERGASRQVTVRYLGPVADLRLEDVPEEHRTEGVRSFVLRRSGASEDRRRELVERSVEDLTRALCGGDRRRANAIADEAKETVGLDAFYVEVVTAAMHRVGERWRRGEISIAVEHLASNLAREIVDRMNAELPTGARRRGTVALCTPPGEMHSLATEVLEGLLLRRGHPVTNISASAPMESILGFLESRAPDFVFVSVTIPALVPNARRLVAAIAKHSPRTRVLVGGQGIRGTAERFPPGVTPEGPTLEVLDGLRATAN